jgi:hypothetical protein
MQSNICNTLDRNINLVLQYSSKLRGIFVFTVEFSLYDLKWYYDGMGATKVNLVLPLMMLYVESIATVCHN